jgi:hypothetical protein
MKIIDIRETQQGIVADVMLNEKSILPMSIPVTECPEQDLIDYISQEYGCESVIMTAAMIALADEQKDPRLSRREAILAAFRDEALSKTEADELYKDLAEIDQAMQFHPSDTCNDFIGASWNRMNEIKF